MNIKKLLNTVIVATSLLTIAACSSRPVDPSVPTGRIYGVIVKVEETPERCEKPSSTGSTIVGAVLGGVLGNKFGSGNGRKATTLAGAVLGGTIGSNSNNDKALICKERGYLYTLAYLDNFNEQKYTVKRFKDSKPVGKTIEFKLKK